MKKATIKFLSAFIFSKKKRHTFREKHGLGRIKKPPCQIGEYSYLSHGCQVADKRTVIGRYCSIGVDVMIGTSRHPTNWISTSPVQYFKGFLGFPSNSSNTEEHQKMFESTKPVVIGNDVWIGMRSIIMDGIKIGDGAIIGAGAIITKDVPPYAIVAGVPARLIRYRFDSATIDRLMKARWWDRDVDFLSKLDFSHVNDCLNMLEAE